MTPAGDRAGGIARDALHGPLVALAAFLALALDAVSGWMIVTLGSSAAVVAGWRHELICIVLAAFAICLATWTQGRSWPQPAAAYAAVAVLVAIAATVFAAGGLSTLVAASALLAGGGLAVLPGELRRSTGPGALRAAVIAGIADIVAATPVFAGLLVAGVLR